MYANRPRRGKPFDWDVSLIPYRTRNKIKERELKKTIRIILLLTYMYPTQSDEILLILNVEDLLLVGCRTGVGCSLLFRNNHMRNEQLILGQSSGQNTACLDILGRIRLGVLQEHLHRVIGDDHGTQ